MSGKQRFLAVQCQRPNIVLHDVGANLHATVGEEYLKPLPVIAEIGRRLAQARLGRDAGALLAHPYPEILDQRCGARLALSKADLGGQISAGCGRIRLVGSAIARTPVTTLNVPLHFLARP